MIFDIRLQAGCPEHDFNIAALTVADNIERVLLGEISDGVCNSWIEGAGMAFQISVFFVKTYIKQFHAFIGF